MIITESIERRFWSRVQKTDSCWLWQGALLKSGNNVENKYGRFSINASTSLLSHRFSWILHNGEIPDSLFVLHTCDIKRCVNPEHLFLGDHIDNMNDAVNKHRFISGDAWLINNRSCKPCQYNGVNYLSLKQCWKECAPPTLEYATFKTRVNIGWPINSALTIEVNHANGRRIKYDKLSIQN
jgi:hypothetical protein